MKKAKKSCTSKKLELIILHSPSYYLFHTNILSCTMNYSNVSFVYAIEPLQDQNRINLLPPLRLGKHQDSRETSGLSGNIRTLGKTRLTVSLGAIH
mgnify:CR=1 FL=1